ncbi:PepSY-associated TM helix domain-containing protein [Hyphococcus sp. DH-69]|uniref:PepSY-associated TM helix domain-containing protein n=1 Tax=Hyphococcus formosus TaxID=3143534 RepID=UPI00398B1719
MSESSIKSEILGRKAQFHRLLFRLHFYAGIIVAPFLLILAVTGAIYLFVTEIEDLAHPDWRFVSEQGRHLSPEEMIGGAIKKYPGATPTRIDLPTAPNRTAVVFLTPQEGEPFRVYVDPVSGEALGSFIYAQTLVGFSDLMHGSLLMGDRGDLIVELASCWAIILIITGLYLWWPRTSNKLWGVFIPRFTKGRSMWRDLHAVTGVWVSFLLLFLLLTGLPWSTNWGGYLQKAMELADISYPASYRSHIDHDVTTSDGSAAVLADTMSDIPWTLETAPAPHSHHGGKTPISIDEATKKFAQEGLITGYRLALPSTAQDVYTAYTYPDQPQGQRTIHLDQYTGEVLNDVSFSDYGIGAKAVELGVALHMGNYFGVPNQLLMLFAALGAALLAISGPVMWMMRRKSGLGAPKAIGSGRAIWVLASIMVVFGILFPVLGVTALFVFAVERLVLSRFAPTREWLGLAN